MVAASLRTATLTTRCAWCDRYLLAGCWVDVHGRADSARLTVTHGICPECVAGLQLTGRSV